jgi:hypothetical protein
MPGRLTLDALEALVTSHQVDTVLAVVPDGFGRLMQACARFPKVRPGVRVHLPLRRRHGRITAPAGG